MTEASNLSDGNADDANDSAHVLQTEMGPQPLSVMKAR